MIHIISLSFQQNLKALEWVLSFHKSARKKRIEVEVEVGTETKATEIMYKIIQANIAWVRI